MNVRIGYWSLEYGELSTEQPIHSFTGTSYRYAEYTDSEKEYCKVLQYEIQVVPGTAVQRSEFCTILGILPPACHVKVANFPHSNGIDPEGIGYVMRC